MKMRNIISGSLILMCTLTTTAIPAMANSGYVYSVGYPMTSYSEGSETFPAIDTTQEAKNAATNIAKAGYTKKVVTEEISDSTITPSWLDSDIVYLAGHGDGNGNAVYWGNKDENLNYRVSANYTPPATHGRNIQNQTLSNTRLAIMAACKSGVSNGIANAFQKQGAKCSIGWTVNVNNGALADYTDILTNYLGDGYTIQNAIKATNADLIDKLVEGTGVFKYKTYGGGVYDTITNTRSVSGNEDSFLNVEGYTDISKQNLNYMNGDDSELVTYIVDHIDSRFDADKFEKYEVMTLPDDDSDMIVAYRYKIGDTVTSFGYNINIEDYDVKGIWSSGEELYDYEITAKPNKSAVLLEENALADSNITDMVISQHTSAYFDSVSKKMVYNVYTVYEDAFGGQYCVQTQY